MKTRRIKTRRGTWWKKAVPAFLTPALLLQLAAHDARAATGLTILKRDLCHSFKLDCRKQRAAPARRPAAKPKPPQQSAKPKPPQEAAKPQTSAPAIPTPVPKPQPPARAAAPSAPLPREKPAKALPAPSTTGAPPPAGVAEAPSPPVPRERPSLLPSLPPVARMAVPEGPARPADPTSGAKMASIPPQAATSPGPSTCVQSLRTAKVTFEVMPASFGEAGCPLADPIRLQAVETPAGTVTFPEGPVFTCRFAQKFAQWVSDTGAPVVLAQTSKRLEKMATGPGYQCRRRNGDSSAKMSEHAAGDAVDITSMTIAGGTTIQMAEAINPASPSYPVLRALRTTACGYFTTVLGPGANAAHKEHYHFDLGVHGKSANYRICE